MEIKVNYSESEENSSYKHSEESLIKLLGIISKPFLPANKKSKEIIEAIEQGYFKD